MRTLMGSGSTGSRSFRIKVKLSLLEAPPYADVPWTVTIDGLGRALPGGAGCQPETDLERSPLGWKRNGIRAWWMS